MRTSEQFVVFDEALKVHNGEPARILAAAAVNAAASLAFGGHEERRELRKRLDHFVVYPSNPLQQHGERE